MIKEMGHRTGSSDLRPRRGRQEFSCGSQLENVAVERRSLYLFILSESKFIKEVKEARHGGSHL